MNVTKRLITVPERQLRDAGTCTERVLTQWDRFTKVASSRIPAPIRAAAPSNGGRSSDTPDPTGQIVLARCNLDDTIALVHNVWFQSRWLAQQLLDYEGVPQTEPAWKLHYAVNYCTAVRGRWEWLTPTDDHIAAIAALRTETHNLEDAVADVLKNHGTRTREDINAKVASRCSGEWDPHCSTTAATDRKGMCLACYWNVRRGIPSPGIAPATASGLDSARLTDRAQVERTAPGASVWCHVCTLDFTVTGDPTVWLEQHHEQCVG